jgi:hypothetical protein
MGIDYLEEMFGMQGIHHEGSYQARIRAYCR